jgi:hypothetical protein
MSPIGKNIVYFAKRVCYMAIGTVIQGVLAVIQVLPTLVDTIMVLTKKVEEESPSGGGEAQKAAVVGVVKAGVNAADKFAVDGEMLDQATKDAIVEVAGETVDVVVGMYNTIGTFKHGSKT